MRPPGSRGSRRPRAAGPRGPGPGRAARGRCGPGRGRPARCCPSPMPIRPPASASCGCRRMRTPRPSSTSGTTRPTRPKVPATTACTTWPTGPCRSHHSTAATTVARPSSASPIPSRRWAGSRSRALLPIRRARAPTRWAMPSHRPRSTRTGHGGPTRRGLRAAGFRAAGLRAAGLRAAGFAPARVLEPRGRVGVRVAMLARLPVKSRLHHWSHGSQPPRVAPSTGQVRAASARRPGPAARPPRRPARPGRASPSPFRCASTSATCRATSSTTSGSPSPATWSASRAACSRSWRFFRYSSTNTADLGAQHPRVERLGQVVDGARRVAAEGVLRLPVDGGQEDDRDVLGPLPALDVRRGLEAVHARHLHVEQDHRVVVGEQRLQRLLAGGRADQGLAEGDEDRLEREQVLRPVVDEQDPRRRGLACGGRHGVTVTRRRSPLLREPQPHGRPAAGRCPPAW